MIIVGVIKKIRIKIIFVCYILKATKQYVSLVCYNSKPIFFLYLYF